MSDTARTDAWNLLQSLGDCVVQYRYAADWRRGRLVGYVYTGDTPMMVVQPFVQDEDMGMLMTEAWKEKIRWADGTVLEPKRFLLVSVDQVRKPELTSRPHMTRNPHRCPLCKQPALVMVTQVHCTNCGCKNYDRES
jgi:hypothetical protein